MTVTTTPVELIQYGGYILGILGISISIWYKRGAAPTSAPMKFLRSRWTISGIAGFLGTLFLVAGIVAHCAKYEARGQIAQKMAVAELPSEWQTFYEGLNKLTDSGLQAKALRRFVESKPPRLTIDNYKALSGARRGFFSNRTKAQHFLRGSSYVREMIIFDFAEGKQEKPR